MAIVVDKNTFEEISLDITKANMTNYLLRKQHNNEIFTMPNCERKYMKIDNNIVVEMTQEEKDVVDQADADAEAQAQADAKDITKLSDPVIKAALVVLAGYAGKTPTQFKNDVISELGG